MDSSLRYFSQTSANFFQSVKDMFSENFMNGDSIFMLAMSFISGAMFRISSASVDITAPDFGSRRELIVPPVMTRTMFGSSCRGVGVWWCWCIGLAFSRMFASMISFSLIPML